MTLGSRKEHLSIMRERYTEARREERTALLDEVCCTCPYAWKYAIALLSSANLQVCRRPRKHRSVRVVGRAAMTIHGSWRFC